MFESRQQDDAAKVCANRNCAAAFAAEITRSCLRNSKWKNPDCKIDLLPHRIQKFNRIPDFPLSCRR